ncbi:glycosyltransferase [Psychroserpens luteus]|uniref:Glycosyltransferase n=1 Tax=Psychroserpens luteus TaxID=1434066 RepID=A0ABW5ZV09_9FLAO|nr:glycosyltransferase [Psychroserpens luteus]
MKVLFWISKFPTFSETFIRDQIIALLDEGLEVFIYTKNGLVNEEEIDALLGFESYRLQERIVNLNFYFEPNKFYRFFKIFPILLSAIFKGQIQHYLNSLKFKKYGKQSKSLRLFYQVHFLLKNKIDVIHAHFGPNGNEAVIFKQIGLPIKLFTTFHGYDIRLGIEKGGDIYADLFNYSNAVISISEFNYQNLSKFGAPKAKIISITNGINIDFYKREKIISNTNKIRILTVARLVDEKALDIAIRAIGELLKMKPLLDFEYIIIGEGDKREELQSIIIELDLTERVTLVGSKTSIEVRNAMHHSDLFLLSSKLESLPTVLLEAQASGLVVLATNVGDVSKIVKAGLVVQPLNLSDFKYGLLDLINNRNNWNNMSIEGQQYINSNHDIRKQTKVLMGIYSSM